MKISNFTNQELREYYQDDKVMFASSRSLHQLYYTKNAGFYFRKIKRLENFCKRGRFHALTIEQVQRMKLDGQI